MNMRKIIFWLLSLPAHPKDPIGTLSPSGHNYTPVNHSTTTFEHITYLPDDRQTLNTSYDRSLA